MTKAAAAKMINAKNIPGVKTPSLGPIHAECGHPWLAHTGESHMTCPALPPAKGADVPVPASVAAGFKKQLEDATGVTAQAELQAKAAANFERAPEAGAAETISVKYISPSPRNPRTSLGDLTELANSLSSLKVMLQPIIVREVDDGRAYEIVSGHRRFAAAVDLGWEEVPCLVHELTEVQALEVNLAEQLQRKELTPLEEGEACRSLIELSGYDTKQVAAKLGQSPSWVTKRLSLCGLAAEVKKSLTKGEITVTLATALAALPTQKMQLEAVQKLEEESYGDPVTTEEQLTTLRTEFCRPLKGVSWKLVDADLVPSAGPCSTCPKNSANNQAPGLFDNVKAPPTCSNLVCFESKMAAAWEKATAKHKAAGAKILPAGEGAKIFNMYDGEPHFSYGSRYVFAKDVVQEDGSKRSWAQIVEKMKPEDRPQLHIAQDPKGGIHELFVKDKATEAIAEHLELKWAKKAIERSEAPAAARVEQQEDRKAQEIREKVLGEVKVAIAKRIAKEGLTLPVVRAMSPDDWMLERYLKALGVEGGQKKWLEKATMNELLAYTFWSESRLNAYDKFDPDFLELAKAYGLDPKAMAKAYVDGAKSEAAIEAKKKAKAK